MAQLEADSHSRPIISLRTIPRVPVGTGDAFAADFTPPSSCDLAHLDIREIHLGMLLFESIEHLCLAKLVGCRFAHLLREPVDTK